MATEPVAGEDQGLDRLQAAVLKVSREQVKLARRFPLTRSETAGRAGPRRRAEPALDVPDAEPGLESALDVPAHDPGTSWVGVLRAVYLGTKKLLEARGITPQAASHAAMRSTRLVWLGQAGLAYAEAAEALGVTSRTVERDLILVRELARDGIEASPGLPPVPPPSDRIRIRPGRSRADRARPKASAPDDLEPAA